MSSLSIFLIGEFSWFTLYLIQLYVMLPFLKKYIGGSYIKPYYISIVVFAVINYLSPWICLAICAKYIINIPFEVIITVAFILTYGTYATRWKLNKVFLYLRKGN